MKTNPHSNSLLNHKLDKTISYSNNKGLCTSNHNVGLNQSSHLSENEDERQVAVFLTAEEAKDAAKARMDFVRTHFQKKAKKDLQ